MKGRGEGSHETTYSSLNFETIELKDYARVPGLALGKQTLSWLGLFGFHGNYNVPGWVTAIYCLNYYPSPWTR